MAEELPTGGSYFGPDQKRVKVIVMVFDGDSVRTEGIGCLDQSDMDRLNECFRIEQESRESGVQTFVIEEAG